MSRDSLAGKDVVQLALSAEQRLPPVMDQLSRIAVVRVEPAPVVLREDAYGSEAHER